VTGLAVGDVRRAWRDSFNTRADDRSSALETQEG